MILVKYALTGGPITSASMLGGDDLVTAQRVLLNGVCTWAQVVPREKWADGDTTILNGFLYFGKQCFSLENNSLDFILGGKSQIPLGYALYM